MLTTFLGSDWGWILCITFWMEDRFLISRVWGVIASLIKPALQIESHTSDYKKTVKTIRYYCMFAQRVTKIISVRGVQITKLIPDPTPVVKLI